MGSDFVADDNTSIAIDVWVNNIHAGQQRAKVTGDLYAPTARGNLPGITFGDVWGWKFSGDLISFSLRPLCPLVDQATFEAERELHKISDGDQSRQVTDVGKKKHLSPAQRFLHTRQKQVHSTAEAKKLPSSATEAISETESSSSNDISLTRGLSAAQAQLARAKAGVSEDQRRISAARSLLDRVSFVVGSRSELIVFLVETVACRGICLHFLNVLFTVTQEPLELKNARRRHVRAIRMVESFNTTLTEAITNFSIVSESTEHLVNEVAPLLLDLLEATVRKKLDHCSTAPFHFLSRSWSLCFRNHN